jgi:predicted extracellular nuclease
LTLRGLRLASFVVCLTAWGLSPTILAAQGLVINEIDYDQPSTDTAEFVEIKNTGAFAIVLGGYELRFVNGSGGGVYDTIALPAVSLGAGDYFVVCANAGTVAHCDLDDGPDTNFIQNGAPDAVALVETAGGMIVDTVSYEGNTVAPYTEGSGGGLEDDAGNAAEGISRCADGADTDQNNVDFQPAASTPGTANACGGPPAVLVINEVDYDQPGTDAAEFVEILNVGAGTADLSGYELQLINGSGATSYDTIALPAVSLAPGDYYVVCANAATVANCDLDDDPNTNWLQNGSPDAVALIETAGGTVVDAVSYEGDTAAPYTEGSGAGLEDDAGLIGFGIARCPDGGDTAQNNVDFVAAVITPGGANACVTPSADLVVNEIDYDQPGTDVAEFVEIKNVGGSAIDLSGFALRFVNGSGGATYQNFPLPAVLLAPGEYFVVCGDAAEVFRCDLDVSPDSNLVQNGAPDAVAIVFAGTGDVVDTVSYEGDTVAPYTEGSGAGLEDAGGGGDDHRGISRFPDGVDSGQNNVDLSPRCITPGAANTSDSFDCSRPGPPALVINEVDYDQPGGDVAEVVEIAKAGEGAADLGGVELLLVNGSGGAIYATVALPSVILPAGGHFVVCANAATVAHCDLDVAPDTNWLQNGAPDAVALRFEGEIVDAVSYEGDTVSPYTEGTGAGVEDSGLAGEDHRGIARVPDGSDSGDNSVDFSRTCITPGGSNTSINVGCSPLAPVVEIFEIQGSGSATPYAGQTLRTVDNAVTAVGPEGFFLQTPSARSDADVDTSDGIYVFTGGAPSVAAGDRVDVTGVVVEFFDFTEFGVPSDLSVLGTGAVPTPVAFDASVPSPDPNAPSCAIEFECYEGMLIAIAEGTVGGPNQFFGSDPIAEVHVTAAPTRALREPGIEHPGLVGLPIWDGNPEVFELDPDKLGLANDLLPAGSSFAATGGLGFEFGGYELWPSELTWTPAPIPLPVRDAVAGELTVGSLNLFRLFDDVDDPAQVGFFGQTRNDAVVSAAEYQRRLAKFSAYIRNVLGAPDVLAVQEVEKLGVLEDLAVRIGSDDPSVLYTPILVEGNDIGTIDVGFLVRDSVVVDAVTQLGLTETYVNPLNGQDELLHDRPPLLLEARSVLAYGEFPITVIVVHNRSLGGIEDPVGGERVREKRLQQARSIAEKVQSLQTSDPGRHIIVLGDFNAFEFTDGYVDAVGRIIGSFADADDLVNDPDDLVEPDLVNQVLSLPAAARYSFVFDGSAQVLDHALTSTGLVPFVTGLEYGRGNADAAEILLDDDTPANAELRSSDHDGLVLFIQPDSDGDGVPDGEDVCPGTAIPESAPTQKLNPNHFALVDGDGIFDTVTKGKGNGPGGSFTVGQTAGCSCEQIVAALGLGNGHLKHGCSIGVMQNWVTLVNGGS